VFEREFELATNKALLMALLFYAGAVLIAHGTYTYLQMVEVLNLVVFTVSIGSQLMAFTERIAKSVQATSDFNKLLNLESVTDDCRGAAPRSRGAHHLQPRRFLLPQTCRRTRAQGCPSPDRGGRVRRYRRPSGAGKSTVAALLQRLYHPTSGSILIGSTNIASMDIAHLRQHISVVTFKWGA